MVASKSTIEEYVETFRKDMGKVTINEWGASMGGPKFPRPMICFNKQATQDTIKHLVDAIGDLNPIFRDKEYAGNTKYGCLIAPPTFFHSIALGHFPNPAPPPDSYSLYSGDEFEYYNPLCEGDEIDWTTTFPTDIKVKQTRAVGTAAFLYGRHEFRRHQGGIPLATCNFWVITYKKSEDIRQKEGSEYFKKPVYTEEYIKEVYAAQDREYVRGDEPRYWEDVQIGEELPPVVRGPYTVGEAVAWIIAGGPYFFCSDRLYRFIFEQTGWGIYDPILKVNLNFHDNLYDLRGTLSKELGTIPASGFAPQRSCWMGMVITNWIGDEGFIWKFRTEHKAQTGYGNVCWCKAKVTNKYCVNKKYCIDIECHIEDQEGTLVLKGNATVILPSRGNGLVFYPVPQN